MGELVTILDLLAPYVEEPGYGGYFREQYDSEPTVFTFQNRHLRAVETLTEASC